MLRKAHRVGDNGTGWAGSLALPPFSKHKCPLTGTIKTELMSSLKCNKNRSGKAKPKAEEFHEEKAISFLCSAYRKISESTLSFPKRYLCY